MKSPVFFFLLVFSFDGVIGLAPREASSARGVALHFGGAKSTSPASIAPVHGDSGTLKTGINTFGIQGTGAANKKPDETLKGPSQQPATTKKTESIHSSVHSDGSKDKPKEKAKSSSASKDAVKGPVHSSSSSSSSNTNSKESSSSSASTESTFSTTTRHLPADVRPSNIHPITDPIITHETSIPLLPTSFIQSDHSSSPSFFEQSPEDRCLIPRSPIPAICSNVFIIPIYVLSFVIILRVVFYLQSEAARGVLEAERRIWRRQEGGREWMSKWRVPVLSFPLFSPGFGDLEEKDGGSGDYGQGMDVDKEKEEQLRRETESVEGDATKQKVWLKWMWPMTVEDEEITAAKSQLQKQQRPPPQQLDGVEMMDFMSIVGTSTRSVEQDPSNNDEPLLTTTPTNFSDKESLPERPPQPRYSKHPGYIITDKPAARAAEMEKEETLAQVERRMERTHERIHTDTKSKRVFWGAGVSLLSVGAILGLLGLFMWLACREVRRMGLCPLARE